MGLESGSESASVNVNKPFADTFASFRVIFVIFNLFCQNFISTICNYSMQLYDNFQRMLYIILYIYFIYIVHSNMLHHNRVAVRIPIFWYNIKPALSDMDFVLHYSFNNPFVSITSVSEMHRKSFKTGVA